MRTLRRQRTTQLRIAALMCAASLSWACGEWSGSSGSSSTAAPSDGFLDLSASAGGVEAFEATVYPIVRQYCAECHGLNQSPLFAQTSVSGSYQALTSQGKVNLANPDASRIVVKLVSFAHHCWSNCAADGATMSAAIQAWADAVSYGSGGVTVEGALASGSQSLGDGVVDTGSERYSGNLVALYEFKEGSGTVARDTSGVDPALPLQLRNGVTWLSSWGVVLDQGFLEGAIGPSRKIYDRIANPSFGTQQYTIEAWVTPDNIDQGGNGPVRIVDYSGNGRNSTLGQAQYDYDVRNRSISGSAIDGGQNGQPSLRTADADQDAQDRLQQVVVTYDQFRGRRIWVDGVFTGDVDPIGPARLWNWDANARLSLGQSDGGWKGQIRMVAIYSQALTDAQIQQNFEAGVGERLLLRFDVSQWMGGGSAVEFVVTDFDPYSYLFCEPTLRTPNPNGSRVANIGIAVNGEIASSGQGFATVDTTANSTKQELSRQCTVIPKGSGGPTSDQFTLIFEHLGGYQNVVVEGPIDPAPIPLDPDPRPANGIRDFARLNASFASVTGQSRSVAASTFAEVKEQLPPAYDVRSFATAQQVAIAKVALDYCSALVDGPDRATFFPGFDFAQAANVAFDTVGERDLVFNPLFDRMVGDALLMQPTRAEVRSALDAMTDQLVASCLSSGTCDATRTTAIVKGACAAVLSSGAVTLH